MNKKQFGVIEPSDLNDIIYNGGKKVYMGGIRVPYIPKNIDCWSNPLDEYKNTRIKSAEWLDACYNDGFALDAKGDKYPIKKYGIEQLAFVAGFWRVQNILTKPIVHVRDKDMVFLAKLDRQENTLFEFYSAKQVGYNCYGPFVSEGNKPDYIVARYDTDNGTFFGYGKTIEEARAYLGLKLYDEYKDVINAIACQKKNKKLK